MTTADIPKVRILDPKGRVVREGYYFEFPAYMGPGIYNGNPKPIPVRRCVATYDQGDWNLPNTPRFLEVTPPHTIEVIDPAAPSANAAPSAQSEETIANISADLRDLSKSMEYYGALPTIYGKPIGIYFAELANRIETANRREIAWLLKNVQTKEGAK